jgi:hypothetical protein
MKPQSLLLVVFSVSCFAEQIPAQKAPSAATKEEDLDYGPVILKNFLGIIPGLFAFAVGRKDDNPELASAALNQVVQGASQFFGALQLVVRSKPGALKNLIATIENKELLMEYLDNELESEECVRSIRSWKGSLLNKEANSPTSTVVTAV